MSFSLDLANFSKKTGLNMRTVIRKVGLDLTTAIILDTPVDTGAARGNWYPSIGTQSEKVSESTDKEGSGAITAAAAVLETLPDDATYYNTNNLPYIEKLEDGSSKQAPQGMVARNVRRFQAFVDEAVRKLS